MIRNDYSVQYVRNYLHVSLTLLHPRMDKNIQIFSQWIASGRTVMFLRIRRFYEWLVSLEKLFVTQT